MPFSPKSLHLAQMQGTQQAFRTLEPTPAPPHDEVTFPGNLDKEDFRGVCGAHPASTHSQLPLTQRRGDHLTMEFLGTFSIIYKVLS